VIAAILILPAFSVVMRYGLPGRYIFLILPLGLGLWFFVDLATRPFQAAWSRAYSRFNYRASAALSPRKPFFYLARVAGVPIFVHWMAPVPIVAELPFLWRWPAACAVSTACYFAVLLVHELGHAAAARWRRCRVLQIEIHAMHGLTKIEHMWRAGDGVSIAWGGVLAQMLVAVPMCALYYWRRPEIETPVGAALHVLGPWNLIMIVLNLLPIPGLDGAAAWSLPHQRRSPVGTIPWRR
jgi:Zn-dependent protease